MRHLVYLALGTNLGNRFANLEAARQALEPEVHILRESPIYDTPPWGYLEQPSFYNQVIEAETDLTPASLLAVLKRLESQLGRKPNFRNGPRLIDLDILFYDDLVWSKENLEIPHPRLTERAFVLVPLNDLAPDLRHPITGVTVRKMLEKIDTTGVILAPAGQLEVD